MDRQSKGCILFDWGDTLMRDSTSFRGPMKDWPTVEAMPGALETLEALHPDWSLALATNAEASTEDDIWAALRRSGLDRELDKVYCFKKIGHKKPSVEFFQYILEDLGLTPDRIVMVGDAYENDVLGANRCGMRAIWFNWQTTEIREDKLHRTVHKLVDIPAILKAGK